MRKRRTSQAAPAELVNKIDPASTDTTGASTYCTALGAPVDQATNETVQVTKMMRTAWADATNAPSAPARMACKAISEEAPITTE